MKKFLLAALFSLPFHCQALDYPDHNLSNAIFSWAKYAGEKKACYDNWRSESVATEMKQTFEQGWQQLTTGEDAIDYLNVVNYFAATGDTSKACLA